MPLHKPAVLHSRSFQVRSNVCLSNCCIYGNKPTSISEYSFVQYLPLFLLFLISSANPTQ